MCRPAQDIRTIDSKHECSTPCRDYESGDISIEYTHMGGNQDRMILRYFRDNRVRVVVRAIYKKIHYVSIIVA